MGKQSFEAGMIAGAKPFEEKFQKQGDAIAALGDRLDSHLDSIEGVVGVILDDGLARERREVYGLNTPFDILTMDDTEKNLTVSLLYVLAQRFGANEFQQTYTRGVQHYLGLKHVQPATSLTTVESVNNLEFQKAILQVVMEYLFLGTFSFDFLDEEEYEELIDAFNVNRKGFRETEDAVNNIYQAIGAEGLAEKYADITIKEDEPEREPKKATLPSALEIKVIEKDLTIQAGETVTFTNEELVFERSIHCLGTLVFDNCSLRYNEEGKPGRIVLEGEGQLTMQHCDVYCNEYRETPFITATSGAVDITDCCFYQCVSFFEGKNMTAFNISGCRFMECWAAFMNVTTVPTSTFVLENSEFFFNTFSPMLLNLPSSACYDYGEKSIFTFGGKADVSNVTAYASYRDSNQLPILQRTEQGNVFQRLKFYFLYLFHTVEAGSLVLRNGQFHDVIRPTGGYHIEIRNCSFAGCIDVVGSFIDTCVFESSALGSAGDNECIDNVVNSTFLSCFPFDPSSTSISVRKCTFYNTTLRGTERLFTFLTSKGERHPGEIIDCTFDGIHVLDDSETFVNSYGESAPALIACHTYNHTDVSPARVRNCHFLNAVSKKKNVWLVQRTVMVTYGFWSDKQKSVVTVDSDRDPVAHPGVYTPSTPNIPTADEFGRPIGGGAGRLENIGVQLAE